MQQVRQAAVFVDRDGTLIRDVGYLQREEQIEVLPQVPEALRLEFTSEAEVKKKTCNLPEV